MRKSFPHFLSSLIFAFLLFFIPGWNEVSAYSTDAETQGVILYVKPGANGNCTSWEDACELQTALFNAVAGDQIWVAAGTYKPSSSNRSATFQLISGVAIYGGFPAAGGEMADRNWEINTTTLSGEIGILNDNADNSYHVVTGSEVDTTAVLDGFTISGGNANGDSGGGMYSDNGSPSLSNVTFSGNAAYIGGGMYNSYSNPRLEYVIFSENTATGYYGGGGMYNYFSNPDLSNSSFTGNLSSIDAGGMYNWNSNPTLSFVSFSNNSAIYSGGGIFNNENSNPTLSDVTFSENSAGDAGGGIVNVNNSNPSLSSVSFSNNSATNSGGGMYNSGSNPTLNDVTFNGNSAYYGGGMSNQYSSSPTLNDVTFSSNTASYYGGGMYNESSSPSLTDVTFSGNGANYGGGMYNYYQSSPSLTNVTFSGNTASYYGGGMANVSGSNPSLSNVTFTGNYTTGDYGYGGGMYNESSSPTLNDVTFSNNTITGDWGYGGGMSNQSNSSPSLTNVTFSGNTSSYYGGGMSNYYQSSPSLTNVTFSGNTATYSGGGMSNSGSSPSLSNVTFSTNSASYGGGMYNQSSSPTITNAILWGNTPEQIYNDYEGSATVTYSDIQGGYTGTGNISADPLLGPLADNGGFTQTHALGENSPAIDTGDPSNCPVIDQREFARPIDGDGDGTAACDMGAYEYGSSLATFSLTLETAGSGTITIDPDKPEYLWREVVTLTAIADPHWVFIGWIGDATTTENPLTVTIVGNTNITANFVQAEYSLDVILNPYGAGSVTIDPLKDTYHYGDVLTLTAVPEPNWAFTSWGGDASGTNNVFTLTVQGNHSITANFINPDAEILHVIQGTNGNCTSWADACELQTALNNAMAGNQIWVAEGTYKPTATTNRSATFQLKSGVAIYGGFPATGGEIADRNWFTNLTTLSGDIGGSDYTGDNSYHVVTGSGVNRTAVLDGFTITGGNANSSGNPNGGGVYNSEGSPTLTNLTISANSAAYSSSSVNCCGGGMYNSSSSPLLANITFSSNSATGSTCYGGGMYSTNSNLTLIDVSFSNNSASRSGGGMANNYNIAALKNVTFTGNSATGDNGGGMSDYFSTSTLNNVTFSGNTAADWGGGMDNYYSNPTLQNVTFSANSANLGGGMLNTSSNPALTNVTFSGNTANDGGGMYNTSGSNPILNNVTFNSNVASGNLSYGGGIYDDSSSPTLMNVSLVNNSAQDGGGIYNNSNSNPTLTNVTLSGNSASVHGGGMVNNSNSNPILTNVTFDGNSANGRGGGMVNNSSSPTLTNVTFSNNITSGNGYGGGIGNWSSYPTLTNVTFFNNSATTNGGALYSSSSSPTLTNVIAWGNTPNQINGSANVSYSDIQGGYTGTGNINQDPLLGPLANNGGFTRTHSLGEGSPAIDTGNPDLCPAMDQRAYFRPIDGDGDGTATCDMGAYEYASYPITFSLTFDIVGNGSIIKDPDKTEYLWGEMVTLTPVADPDWVFIGWGGDTSGMENPLTFAIFEDTNIAANFEFDSWTISLSVFPEGSGSVVADPEQPTYHYGDQVTLTALPNPGWSFAGWTGDAGGTSSQVIVTMTDNLEITANFAQIEYSLSVSVNPPGMGTVTKSPNKPYYVYGDVVTLTANSAITGWRFIGWSGDASGVENPLQVTITGNNNIIANFSDQYTLTTIVDPLDSGTITRDIYQDTYTYGTQVVLTATPSLGWTFDGWGGDGSGSDNPLTYTIVGDTSITATFTQNEYTLVVNVEPVGSGTVNIYPMQTTYHYGDEVTLTSVANSGWTFLEWSGDATGSDNPLTVTIHGDTNITANFMQDQYTLDVTIEGFGSVAIDPVQATYIYGTEVTLTATADPSWRFVGWSGDASGSDNPLIFTIQRNTSITALFTTNWIFLPMITR